jgi:lipopolysaccharide export system permease protein
MRVKLKRLERYVLVHDLVAIAGAASIIGSIVLLIDFVELSRFSGGDRGAGFFTIFMMAVLKTPSIMITLLPFIFLFGTLAAFVSLNRHSELVAMRAAGISAWRFILPAAAAAFVIGILTVAAFNPIAAGMEARFEQVRATISAAPADGAPRRIWLRQGDARTQVIIGAADRGGVGGVSLRNVSFFVYTLNAEGDPVFSRRIEAEGARLMNGYWRLSQARDATPGATAVRYDTLSIPSTLDQQKALEKFASPQSISFWQLPEAIGRIEEAGFSATTYRLRLQQLLATPFLFAGMSILAAAFSLKLMRLGGLFALAGTGATAGFVFFFFDQLCGSLGKAAAIPPSLAAWIPPLLAVLSGFTVLFHTEDG